MYTLKQEIITLSSHPPQNEDTILFNTNGHKNLPQMFGVTAG